MLTSACLDSLSKMGSMNYFGQVVLQNIYLKTNFEKTQKSEVLAPFFKFSQGKFS